MGSTSPLQANPLHKRPSHSAVFLNTIPLVWFLALWPFGGGGKIIMSNAQSVPGAKGVVHVSHDSNGNTKVDMNVQYLAPADSLTPPENAYVVWIDVNGRPPERMAELKVGSDRSGSVNFVTPEKRFTVFVTAEQSAQVGAPTGQRLLSANVNR